VNSIPVLVCLSAALAFLTWALFTSDSEIEEFCLEVAGGITFVAVLIA
jgi:hypothetical protein